MPLCRPEVSEDVFETRCDEEEFAFARPSRNCRNLEDRTDFLPIISFAVSSTKSLGLVVWQHDAKMRVEVDTNATGEAWYLQHKPTAIAARL